MQVLAPLHQAVGANLGSRTAAWLYDQLTRVCVRPPGIGHLEDPKLTTDLGDGARLRPRDHAARRSRSRWTSSRGGLVEFVGGRRLGARCSLGYAWWAPLLLAGAWLATHWLLRESAVWKDRNTDEVREAQRHADYAYRLAVDPPAAKELRLFGLAGWTIDRFRARRRLLHELQYRATRLRERPLGLSSRCSCSARTPSCSRDGRGGRRRQPARSTGW